jgi:hypothetical protein
VITSTAACEASPRLNPAAQHTIATAATRATRAPRVTPRATRRMSWRPTEPPSDRSRPAACS